MKDPYDDPRFTEEAELKKKYREIQKESFPRLDSFMNGYIKGCKDTLNIVKRGVKAEYRGR